MFNAMKYQIYKLRYTKGVTDLMFTFRCVSLEYGLYVQNIVLFRFAIGMDRIFIYFWM